MIHGRLVKQLAVATCLLALSIKGSMAGDDSSLPVTAIWHVQNVQLNLRTLQTYYSCDTLKNKIAKILTAVGARNDIIVDLGCNDRTLTNSARVAIALATPIEATPENIAAATTYTEEQQLVARVHGERLPSASDLERFDATWRSVSLHKQRKLGIDPADCDLLQSLASQIFPQLGIRIEARKFNCPSSSFTRVMPEMRVTALIAAAPALPVAYVPRSR